MEVQGAGAHDYQAHTHARAHTCLDGFVASLRDPKDFRGYVSICKHKECYDSEKGSKVEIMFGYKGKQIQAGIEEFFEGLDKAEIKDGRAPRGGVARQTQAQMNKLGKMLNKDGGAA